MVQGRRTGAFDMDGGLPQFSQEEIMSSLLAASELGDEEPEIAANITQQMLHMELEPLSRSMRARLRDIVVRLAPSHFIEVGAGIGQLSAWFHDAWEDGEHPNYYAMVDEGQRFGVILQRVVERYSATDWCHVRVGPWDTMVSESIAWLAANASMPEEARSGSILPVPADVVLVNTDWRSQVKDLEKAFQLLRPGGVLLTPEPLVPSSDVGDYPEGEPQNDAQMRVEVFNHWIRLVQQWSTEHAIGIVEVKGGSIVAIRRLK